MAANHVSLLFQPGKKICAACRIHLHMLYEEDQTKPTASSRVDKADAEVNHTIHVYSGVSDEKCSSSSREDDESPSQDCTLMALNEMLNSVGESPVLKRKVRQNRHFVKAKIRKVEGVVKKVLKCGARRGRAAAA